MSSRIYNEKCDGIADMHYNAVRQNFNGKFDVFRCGRGENCNFRFTIYLIAIWGGWVLETIFEKIFENTSFWPSMAAVIIAGIIRGPLRDFIGRIKRVNKHGVTMNEGDPAIKTTSSEAAQAEMP